ncbi:MAG TPA: SRPBCC family protein [Gemmatimonadales bacterium]|nr:SRPBCC family protein [Gemmatimonadales bacterium]
MTADWGRPSFDVNVGRTERWISGIAGALLLGYGLRRPRYRPFLAPLGIGLIGRAVSGRSLVNRALGRNSARGGGSSPVASLESGEGTRIDRTVFIARSAGDLYRFWRQFDTLPRFMENLESVTVVDPRRSHWVAKGPLGARVEWDAEVHNEIPNELIAWRSLPGSEVDQAGSVHFTPTGNGTEVRVVLRYAAPAGKVGDAVARLLGDDPSGQIADDLRRFKQVMEAGEVPTVF